ncbi:MAG: hypothetical protein SPD11_13300 [Sphaerochaetaceae bacterium]|nr:hypothetical protein [Sphaerochaetaceae bacterium]
MKRTMQILLMVLVCLGMFVGCEMKIPNPLIGCYVLPAESVGAGEYHLAALSLRKDGTFAYVEVITGTSELRTVEGKYVMELQAYDFLSADGNLYLTVENVPTDVENLLLSKGTNPFLYDWACDRNEGPKSLTLVRDADNPNNNLEMIYKGGPDVLSKNIEALKVESRRLGGEL